MSQLSNSDFNSRLAALAQLKNLILRDQDLIINRIVKETKKTKTDALMSEIFPTLDHLDFLLKAGPKILKPQTVKTPWALLGKTSLIEYGPLGKVLVIAPWNYPFYQAIVPCSSSYLCGNQTIFKPSEITPLSGLLEDLFKQAGIGTDSIKIIYGDGKVGEQLMNQTSLEQPLAKVFFTGSVATGKKIMAQAAQNLTAVELELGGKDAMIVFAGTNLHRATSAALWGALTNTGQSCTSIERIYVADEIFNDFYHQLLNKAAQLTDQEIGLMTTTKQAAIVANQIKEAQNAGVEFKVFGLVHIAELTQSQAKTLKIATEETFGPVLLLMRFKTEAEAIQLANDSVYGLAASVWSNDINQARRVSRQLNVGNVSINNVMLTEANHYLPFGGVKQSGFGRIKGTMGLQAFCNVKSIIIDKNSSKIEANWYPFTQTKYKLFTKMMQGLFKGGWCGFLNFIYYGLKLERHSNLAGNQAAARQSKVKSS